MFDFFAVYMLIQVVLAFMLCFFGYRHLRLLLWPDSWDAIF